MIQTLCIVLLRFISLLFLVEEVINDCVNPPTPKYYSLNITDILRCGNVSNSDICNLSCPSNSHVEFSNENQQIINFLCSNSKFSPEFYACVCNVGFKMNESKTGCEECTGEVSATTDLHTCVSCNGEQFPNTDKTACEHCKFWQVLNTRKNGCDFCDSNEVPDTYHTACESCIKKNQVPNFYNSACVEYCFNSIKIFHSAISKKFTSCDTMSINNICDVTCPPNSHFIASTLYNTYNLVCDPSGRLKPIDDYFCICDDGYKMNEEGNGCEPCTGEFNSITSQNLCDSCNGDEAPNNEKTACVPCKDKQVSNKDHSECETCRGLIVPNPQHTACETCSGNTVSDGFICEPCRGTNVPNEDHSGCVDHCQDKPKRASNSLNLDTASCDGKIKYAKCSLTCPEHSHSDGNNDSNLFEFICEEDGQITPNTYSCVCDDGYKMNISQEGCEECTGNMVSISSKTACDPCRGTNVPNKDHSGCVKFCQVAPKKALNSLMLTTKSCESVHKNSVCTLTCPPNSHTDNTIKGTLKNSMKFICKENGEFFPTKYNCICDAGYEMDENICRKKKISTSGSIGNKEMFLNIIFLVVYVLLNQ